MKQFASPLAVEKPACAAGRVRGQGVIPA